MRRHITADSGLWFAFAAFAGLELLDAVSTLAGLSLHAAVEGNPVPLPLAFVGKAVTLLLVASLIVRLRLLRRPATRLDYAAPWAVLVVCCLALLVLVTHNFAIVLAAYLGHR